MLGPSTALYLPSQERPTLKNAMGTLWLMWLALSKPPQWRHGLDPHVFWLLVGTTSTLVPELYPRQTKDSLLWRMPLCIFDYFIMVTIEFCELRFYDLLLWLIVDGPRSWKRVRRKSANNTLWHGVDCYHYNWYSLIGVTYALLFRAFLFSISEAQFLKF